MTRGRTRRPVYQAGEYQYRGDPAGPGNGRSLRLNGGRWRKGSPDEWAAITGRPPAPERCRACLGMGYKGRDRAGAWKIENCQSCGGSGQRVYTRAEPAGR